MIDEKEVSKLEKIDYNNPPELALMEPDIVNLTEKRVIVQHSVFVYAKEGYIDSEKYKAISVPKKFKKKLLEHLRQIHNVDTNSIYNDPIGFVENDQNYETARFYFYRGNAYGRIGDYDLAIVDFTRAIDLDPDDNIAYNNRGIAYVNKGEYDLAIADYDKAIDLEPDYAVTYNSRGVAHRRMGEYDSAIEDYNKAIDLNPDYVNAYNNRGVAYFYNTKYVPAMVDYNKAIKLNPDFALSYYNHGILFLVQEKWDDARSYLSKAQEKGLDIASEFKDNLGTLDAFEKKYKVKLPDDIAEMLRE